MKFRNYCVVILGNTSGVMPEIEKISEIKPRYLDSKGIIISTFASNLEPREVNDWFKMNDRSFLVFDLHPDSSGYNITKPEIQEGLFGFIKLMNLEEMDRKMELFKTVVESDEIPTPTIEEKKELTEDDVNKMNSIEKKKLFDKLLDNGIDKLTENDKKIMPFLVK